jgi:hypothetical protein
MSKIDQIDFRAVRDAPADVVKGAMAQVREHESAPRRADARSSCVGR